jgi:tetratricopeptide (TPR) repeat protein
MQYGRSGVEFLQPGKADEGIAELQKSVRLRPNFAPAHETLADAYIDKRDFDNAAAELRRVIVLSPRNEKAHYELGMIYLEQQLPAKAQETFAQLLKIDPNSAHGHEGLADALANQRQDREALEEYKRAAAIDPNYPDVYFSMGQMEARLKLYDDAIASLVKQRQTADNAENENLLSDLYETMGLTKDATTARQKATQLAASH